MHDQLSVYLERIGYFGSMEPELGVLKSVHRGQVATIAYENLDVYQERPVQHDLQAVFEKLVSSGRGGWCYEQNTLLGWALRQMGFEVTRLCGGVMREVSGDDAFGNHLVLMVHLDEPWIADCGLGDGVLEPFRLVEGKFNQSARVYRLEKLEAEEWRFHNHKDARPPSFDLHTGPVDEAHLSQVASKLQTDPESMFRKNLICQRMTDAGTHALRGRVLSKANGETRVLRSAAELTTTLTDVFGITDPPLDGLWERVQKRHEEVFPETTDEDIEALRSA